VNILLIP